MSGEVSETTESAVIEILVRVSVPEEAEMNGQFSEFSALNTKVRDVKETAALSWKTYDVPTASTLIHTSFSFYI